MSDTKLQLVSWSDYETMINDLLSKINKHICVDDLVGVYGPPRGGLVLAVSASHYFNVPILMHPCNSCLVIDDIVDSGKTFLAITQYCKPLAFASLFTTFPPPIPDLYSVEFKYAKFIVFPWESSGSSYID